jgi:hypothetical protein
MNSIPWITTRPIRPKKPLEAFGQLLDLLSPGHKHSTVRLVTMFDGSTQVVCDECLAEAEATRQ